ncbi:MAG: hypothetical protein KGI29_08235 [Pseudomonadota bacterium]|nr:hypothetical protein [Pseudomonadota bacterium]MDE3037418.1 hypothetical protein [Pseudomonadota bacterium]
METLHDTGVPHTIDVTGLPPEAAWAVESLVGLLRRNASMPSASVPSMFTLFGKAAALRTADDITRQLRQERDAWGEV